MCHGDKKRVTALRCLFLFFERMIAIRRKKNYHSKAHFVLYNIDSRSISFGDCLSQELESWARALEIEGPFLSQCYETINHFCTLNSSMEKHQFFTVNRTQRAASNDVWTNFLAIIVFEIFGKKCVKNVTALRCLFSFFERMITIRRKTFLSFESSFRALQHWFQVHFIWRLPLAGNWELSSSTGNWGSFFDTVLRDYKTFLYTK